MKRLLPLLAGAWAVFATMAHASSVPDFWYVVSDETSATASSKLVRGIVIPSSVSPTVETTPSGSVIAWPRPDGTRRSLVVQGVSSFTFAPGPLDRTTYVPFRTSKVLAYEPRDCCSCASWQNSVESVEALSCVVGCNGCGCEGCICSPTFPCPTGPDNAMTLVADDGAAPTMTFDRTVDAKSVTIVAHGGRKARFHGKHLKTRLTERGETTFDNPDSIALTGGAVSRSTIRGEDALFAWVSPGGSVVLRQHRSMPAPSFHDGVIDFDARPDSAPKLTAKRLEVGPVKDRCSACGTHPNSEADLDLYDCVPGFSVCYRCVSWDCVVEGS